MKTTIATTILLASTASAFPTFEEFAKKFEKKYTRAERALRAAIYAKNILAYQEHNEKNIVGVFPQVQLSLFLNSPPRRPPAHSTRPKVKTETPPSIECRFVLGHAKFDPLRADLSPLLRTEQFHVAPGFFCFHS